MNVADVAAIHSFGNTHDVNGLGRRGDIGMDAPNERMQLTGPAFVVSGPAYA